MGGAAAMQASNQGREWRNLIATALLAASFSYVCVRVRDDPDILWSKHGALHWMLGGHPARNPDDQEVCYTLHLKHACTRNSLDPRDHQIMI